MAIVTFEPHRRDGGRHHQQRFRRLRSTPGDQGQRIDSAQRLANASIVEVADAGHSTYFERPDLYNDALIAFIEKVGR